MFEQFFAAIAAHDESHSKFCSTTASFCLWCHLLSYMCSIERLFAPSNDIEISCSVDTPTHHTTVSLPPRRHV